MNAIVPLPTEPITIREATHDDLPWIDALQKTQSKSLGFLQLKALEGKIAQQQILIAEKTSTDDTDCTDLNSSSVSSVKSVDKRIGYVIGQDRYFKRDDVGIIYQMNIVPAYQRGFVASALLQAQFDRSAYGCRLYCCWCAQDLDANKFWEAMGFVPLAFRAGSAKKDRVHIFWQKKIREHDDSCHWWFPSKTDQGAIRADRLVFPIPPGTHWSEVKAVVVPQEEHPLALPASSIEERREKRSSKRLDPAPGLQRIFFAPAKPVQEKAKKTKTQPKQPKKIDPKYVSAARELRDRYLEQVNETGFKLESSAKYLITRAIADAQPQPDPVKLLAA